MQRMSAIATKTNYLATLIAPYNVQILDTRKTTPNFRICEKWAVRIGGGVNHRFGLYDQFLIKDNHIKAVGGIKNAIQSCISYKLKMNLALPIVVEVSNIDEFNIAKEFDEVDRLLIDNFKPDQIKNLLNLNTTKKIIEVHISIVYAREIFRKESFIAPVSLGVIAGFGLNSYDLAVQALMI
jgi:nicotinate-nucleotide pyrophosphorylase (carboxylating)